MTNDTTRMEKLADDLSAVTIPSCKHMEREEYRDCVMQMLDDLEQLGRRDGCIAAAWALDALPSLQRELAEARKIMADAASALTNDGLAGVIAAQHILLRAPAPSDVKGEERIKELEAERDAAIGELSAERDLCDKWELANREAERLRKAIGEQPLYAFVVDFPKKDEPYYMRVHDRWMIAPNDFSNNQWEVYRRWSPPEPAALSPSPAAASGGMPAMESAWLLETHIGGTPVWYTSHNPCRHFTTDACAADKFSGKDEAEKFASDIGLPRDWKATEHGFDSSPVPAADYLNKMADAEDAAGDISIGTSAPAAEGQGNSQHHIEGAKIPEGGSGSSSAESEGGETEGGPIRRMWESLKDIFGPWNYPNEADVDEAWDRFSHKVIAMRDERDALSARLAACEERCRELEAGIEKHQRQHQAIYEELDGAEKFDKDLWSLLAPKAGWEV